MYVRNAPSMHGYGGRNFSHLFDAFSALYAWTWKEGTVEFANRYTPSAEWNMTMQRGSLAPTRLLGGVTPPWNFTEWMQSLLTFPDNAAINVWRFGSEENPSLASTTDEMVFHSFDFSPSIPYAGPLRFSSPPASAQQDTSRSPASSSANENNNHLQQSRERAR